MKTNLTTRGGPIACNETLPVRTTADTYRCNERQNTGEACTFRCIPQSCVTQQLQAKLAGGVNDRGKYGYGNELHELLSTFR
jgi:hypothetical protein